MNEFGECKESFFFQRVNMDIRDFVKIKRIPGGSIEDSVIVKGEVFSNRVIRVGMPLSIGNCNVLLVKDSIAYAREDRYNKR
jgi:1-phosphatidylinositol-3-phosphate 5-kinase